MEKSITLTESQLKELIARAWQFGYDTDKSASVSVELGKDTKHIIRTYHDMNWLR